MFSPLFCRLIKPTVLLTRAGKPILGTLSCCIVRQTHPGVHAAVFFASPLQRFYRSTFRRARKREKTNSKLKTENDDSENIDDLKSLMQDKSLTLTAKFKVLFQQYGAVLIVVHCITAAFWMGLFYFTVSRGFDIIPFLEKYGVFNFLEKIGLPASEKLKSPGASNLLAAYLLYEVAKPIRYPVTLVGTIYAVRILRKFKFLNRPPPSDTTVRELVKTQGKIVQHHFKSTASKYQTYTPRLRRNGKKNGRKH